MLCVTLCTIATTPGVTSVENGASPAENLLLLKLLRFVGIFSQGWKGIRVLSLALLELCIGTLLHVIGFVEQKSTCGVVIARGAVRCIMGGGKAVSSAGASFAREYDLAPVHGGGAARKDCLQRLGFEQNLKHWALKGMRTQRELHLFKWLSASKWSS